MHGQAVSARMHGQAVSARMHGQAVSARMHGQAVSGLYMFPTERLLPGSVDLSSKNYNMQKRKCYPKLSVSAFFY